MCSVHGADETAADQTRGSPRGSCQVITGEKNKMTAAVSMPGNTVMGGEAWSSGYRFDSLSSVPEMGVIQDG